MPKDIVEELKPDEKVNLYHLGEREIDELRKARWRARTDFFYLANVVLGKDLICPEFNGNLVKNLQKFPAPTPEQAAVKDRWTSSGWAYTPVIERLIDLPGKRRNLFIDFRGSMKTTANCECHGIQWVINYPTACIAIFQYKLEKAESILKAIKDHFLFNEKFRTLFPELCPPPDKLKDFGTKEKFSVYNINKLRKTSRREDTFMVAALEAGLAGYHFEVMKFSDVVDTENSENLDQCTKTIHKFGQAQNLLIDPTYWMDVEGTRYHFGDLYGKIIKDWEKDAADNGEDNTVWQVYTRGIFKPDKPENELKFYPYELEIKDKLDENGEPIPYDLPDRLNTKKWPLRHIKLYEATDPVNFAAQMRNCPQGGRGGLKDFVLNENRNTGKLEPPHIVPKNIYHNIKLAYKVVSVDPAETTNDRSNYTAILVVGVDRDGRRYVEQIIHGKWDPTGVSDKIIFVCDRYRPDALLLEEVSATRNLMPGIKRVWDYEPRKHHIPIVKFNKRDTKLKKEEKIRLNLHTPYHMGNLRFVQDQILQNGWDNLILELKQFPRGQQDDILDALAEVYASAEWFGQEFARTIPQQKKFIPYTKELQNRLVSEAVFGPSLGEDSSYPDEPVYTLTPTNFTDYIKKVGGL